MSRAFLLALVLVAAVSPQGLCDVDRSGPDWRKRAYLQALRTQKLQYRAFGERINISGNSPARTDPTFQGRTFDAGLGIYDYRNRSFDPATGRFLQRDPVLGGDPLFNPYGFPGANPVTGRDPFGTGLWDWITTGEWNPTDKERLDARKCAGNSNVVSQSAMGVTHGVVEAGSTLYDAGSIIHAYMPGFCIANHLRWKMWAKGDFSFRLSTDVVGKMAASSTYQSICAKKDAGQYGVGEQIETTGEVFINTFPPSGAGMGIARSVVAVVDEDPIAFGEGMGQTGLSLLAMRGGGSQSGTAGEFVGLNRVPFTKPAPPPVTPRSLAGTKPVPISDKFTTLAEWQEAVFRAMMEDEAAANIGKGKGPVESGCLDRMAGRVLTDFNHEAPPAVAPEIIVSRIKSCPPGRHPSLPGSHSEVHVLGRSMMANPGAGLSNFLLYNLRLRSFKGGRPLSPVERCGNCKFITEGVECLSDEPKCLGNESGQPASGG